jgi:hypothetical protein
MEKLVYVLWKPADCAPDAHAEQLRGELATRFAELGDRGLTLNVADGAVAKAASVRRSLLDPPPSALVSFWLDCADDRAPYEAAIDGLSARSAGYLVAESVPIVNETQPAPPAERTPGVNMIALLERPEAMPWDAWIAHWHGHHRQVAIETQCTFHYVRNVVVRALTEAAPPWSGIVEEGFPAEAVTDPMLWYKANGSQETLRRNLGRMVESCQAFLDLERVESHPMSEYRIRG